jgi:phenylalanyl-tRNA synthetase alpha chain
MGLAEFLSQLDQLAREALAAFEEAGDAHALEAARIEFLGAKSGRLKALQKGLGQLDKPDKPTAGKRFNEVKQELLAAFAAAKGRMETVIELPALRLVVQVPTPTVHIGPGITGLHDPTVPGVRPRLGHLHPITQTAEELKDIMGRLGFTVAEGPEVEDQWHNFEALNIPPDHPARDPLDNFYLATAAKTAGTSPPATPRGGSGEEGWLLRSQTSTVQIRVMERTSPPVRVISVGRVYRPDTADATHYPMFHQIEGLLVDRHVTMADLKSILRLFASSFFEDEVHIRFRPSFFPFTEPSVEVDMSWQGGWIEIAGAGMVDPNVLSAVGYDPEKVTGLAFGVGIERICMGRHGVDDIREFYKNDVRFLHQF